MDISLSLSLLSPGVNVLHVTTTTEVPLTTTQRNDAIVAIIGGATGGGVLLVLILITIIIAVAVTLVCARHYCTKVHFENEYELPDECAKNRPLPPVPQSIQSVLEIMNENVAYVCTDDITNNLAYNTHDNTYTMA